MILESLSRAAREQNYYAVLLEFLIVIVGLVIGFQIQAWSEARGEGETERLILCRLASDFEQIVAIGRRNRESAEASLEAARAVVAAATAGMTPQDLDTVDLIGAQSTVAAPAGSPTYTQLVSSGDMALIRSEALRESLTVFHENLARFQRTDPVIAPIANRTLVFSMMGLSSQEIAALPEEIQEGLSAQLSSAEFFLDARRTYFAQYALRNWYTNLLDRASKAADDVEAALTFRAAACPAAAVPSGQ